MTALNDGLTILWRGSLESCNYGCPYCPFAKTTDDRAALAADRKALERFAVWASTRNYPVSILITPWGEGLIRKYYRETMTTLSHEPNIQTIAIQTNLSCSVDWVADCDLSHIAFWTTYHPGETKRASFVAKIQKLEALGARYSVGVVGMNEHLEEIEILRKELSDEAYLWVNAYKRVEDYYSSSDLERIISIDPFFELNNRTYATQGRACAAGATAISVLADGTARRCHFLREPIGNIYNDGFEKALVARPCTASECRCHIGYSHLGALDLEGLYGNGFIERRPEQRPSRQQAISRMQIFDDQVS